MRAVRVKQKSCESEIQNNVLKDAKIPHKPEGNCTASVPTTSLTQTWSGDQLSIEKMIKAAFFKKASDKFTIH